MPLLPAVPFLILSAFCFARSSPTCERWLLNHPKFGAPIRLWQERGAISRAGKRSTLIVFAFSAVLSLALLALPWSLIPLVPALINGTWIWCRPEN